MKKLLACIFLSLVPLASAKVVDKEAIVAGLTVNYKVVLPANYDPEKTYPGILAFPPGDQSMMMVMTTLQRNWSLEAQKRGYIVVIPAAPERRAFSREGAKVFPEFVEKLLADYKIRDNKFHIAGMSNGGMSAFHLAALHPQYFISITGFPGYLQDPTPERIAAISKMCIHMHVGELDAEWRGKMEAQVADFKSKGIPAKLTVEPGENHVIGALTGDGSARLFNEIESCR